VNILQSHHTNKGVVLDTGHKYFLPHLFHFFLYLDVIHYEVLAASLNQLQKKCEGIKIRLILRGFGFESRHRNLLFVIGALKQHLRGHKHKEYSEVRITVTR
jgi:hypothetical protein